VTSVQTSNHLVAVVGAGPAGLFAARQLASNGVQVVLLNRDIKPGGLAEYGIYPDKHKMKDGLRKHFNQILATPGIEYYGNVVVGQAAGGLPTDAPKADLSMPILRALGFQAILVTVGAQGTKWLGLAGEALNGVYHAKDLVYYYNQLPPYSLKPFRIGRRVAVIGVGNVMMDIAHWLIHAAKVDEVVAVARRGPAEVKFSKKELENVGQNIDLAAFEDEMRRVAPTMIAVGQDTEAARQFILSGAQKAENTPITTRFRFEFLTSPRRILDDGSGCVGGLEVEDTTLALSPTGEVLSKSLGTLRTINVDSVIFCIGDRVDENFGLPVRKNEFVKHPQPRFPVEGISYEAYDPDQGLPVERVFVAGWAREASSGLVGVARKDGEYGAQAVLQYLHTQPPLRQPQAVAAAAAQYLKKLPKPVITYADIQRLAEVEQAEAARRKLEAFKFDTNDEMFIAMGLA